MPPRGRRDRPRRLQAFQNDPQLLIIRPTPPPTRLNNIEPFNLCTDPIAVHKRCYTTLSLNQQAPEGDSFPSSIQFSACNNTKEGMEKREGRAVSIIPQAELVPSGAVRLIELQEDGWSYLRP